MITQSRRTKMTETNPYLQDKETWETTTLQETLKRLPERQDPFVTTSSRPVERLYGPNDTSYDTYREKLNFPGQYPYTRGVHASGYRGKLWTMRMFAGFGIA